MLAETFIMGAWKSIAEMEDNLTLDELVLIRDAYFKERHETQRFAAALKGIDLDADSVDERFQKVKAQVEADLMGMSEDEYFFNQAGIDYEQD